MKPYFIPCSIDSITYLRREVVVNKPINLSLCKSIEKVKYRWYPDNVGKPAIRFNGCDTEWVYENETDRDKDYLRLVSGEMR